MQKSLCNNCFSPEAYTHHLKWCIPFTVRNWTCYHGNHEPLSFWFHILLSRCLFFLLFFSSSRSDFASLFLTDFASFRSTKYYYYQCLWPRVAHRFGADDMCSIGDNRLPLQTCFTHQPHICMDSLPFPIVCPRKRAHVAFIYKHWQWNERNASNPIYVENLCDFAWW